MSATEPLDAVRWELADLLDGGGAGDVEALLDQALERARAFAERYRGALATIDGAGLATAMAALGEIYELLGRADSYASLDFSTDTIDPARGALVARVQERSTELATLLLFFELEWAALSDQRVEELLRHDALDFCRHHLRTARRYRPHLLSEPEERILTEKSVSGVGAWTRLFAELTSAIEVSLEETVTLDVALARLASPSREVRREGAAAVTRALEPGLRTRAFVFNTLLVDKATDDRLRSYQHWLAARNLANEASDESVAALVVGGARSLRACAALVSAQGKAARHRPSRRLRPHGTARRGRGACRLAAGARDRARRLQHVLAERSASSPSASSSAAGSTRRRSTASAAAPSAPTRSPQCTPTCCSTSPAAAATC